MKLAALKSAWSKTLRRVFLVLYFLPFGVALGAVADSLGDLGGAPFAVNLYFAAGLIFLAWIVIIAIHEVGHASAAWLLGWRVSVIAIRGLTIWPGKWRARYGLPAFPRLGGAVLIVPPKGGDWRAAYLIVLLGGGITNFLFAVLLLTAAAILFHHSVFWLSYLRAIAFLSTMTGVLNLLPIKMWGRETDGFMAGEVWRGKELGPMENLMRLGEEMVSQKRPRDWAADLVDPVKQDFEAGLGDGHLGLVFFQFYFDRGEMAAARDALSWAAGKLGNTEEVRILRAFCSAFFDKDSQSAQDLLGSIGLRSLKKQPNYLVAAAAVARARGDKIELERAIARARDAIRKAPFSTIADFDFLEALSDSDLALSTAPN